MWKVVGSGHETKLIECGDGTLSYDEAKVSAKQRLTDCLSPLAARLQEIDQDVDMTNGKQPECKAWVSQYGSNTLVAAKTKKRAAEIAGYSRSGFDAVFTRCEGHWWYEYAQEEGTWRKASSSCFDMRYEKKS